MKKHTKKLTEALCGCWSHKLLIILFKKFFIFSKFFQSGSDISDHTQTYYVYFKNCQMFKVCPPTH